MRLTICLLASIFCNVAFPENLKEIPYIYLNEETRNTVNSYPAQLNDEGFIFLTSISMAQKVYDHLPPDVNFDSENVIVFSWGGSGGDYIVYDKDQSEDVYHFVLKRGLTRDYRSHIKMYVIPKNSSFLFHKVEPPHQNVVVKSKVYQPKP